MPGISARMRAPTILAAVFSVLASNLPAQGGILVQPWGSYEGQGVDLFTLANKNSIEARITNYGGIIVSIKVPGRDGTFADVVQGFDSLADYTSADYLKVSPHYGALIGRYANRIKNNTYVVDGATYRVTRDGVGYFDRVWTAAAKDGDEPQLILDLVDPDGSMGFPGTVKATVTYTLTRNNILRIDYRATTDRDTIVNLTNHSYFNMAGGGTVLDQLLSINADSITPSDEQNVPTGEVRSVAGTAFDFRRPMPIGLHIGDPEIMLQRAHGYDHNFVIDGAPGTLRLAARLEDPKSGRVLEEWTTQPGIQVYTANYKAPAAGLAKGYVQHGAVALETEHAPNSPNIPSFASPEVTPAAPLHEISEFRFLVAKAN